VLSFGIGAHLALKSALTKAVDIEVWNTSSGLYQRVVMVEQDLITLMIEAPAANRALAARLKPVFFESLVIEQR
jgi:hypothetical protein